MTYNVYPYKQTMFPQQLLLRQQLILAVTISKTKFTNATTVITICSANQAGTQIS